MFPHLSFLSFLFFPAHHLHHHHRMRCVSLSFFLFRGERENTPLRPLHLIPPSTSKHKHCERDRVSACTVARPQTHTRITEACVWEQAVDAAKKQLESALHEALRSHSAMPAEEAAVVWDTLFHARVVRLRAQQTSAPALEHVAAAGTALFGGIVRHTATAFFRTPDLFHALWDSLSLSPSCATGDADVDMEAEAATAGQEEEEESVCSFCAWCLLRAGDLQRYCGRGHVARQCYAAARCMCPAEGAVYNQLALADAAVPCVWALYHDALAAAATHPAPRSHGNLVVVLRRHATRHARTRTRTAFADALADALAALLLPHPEGSAPALPPLPASSWDAGSNTVADAERRATALVALVLYAERCTRTGPRHGDALTLLAATATALVRCEGAAVPAPNLHAWTSAAVALHVLLMWCVGSDGAALGACPEPARTALWTEAALVLNALSAVAAPDDKEAEAGISRPPLRLLHEEAELLAFAPVAEHMAVVQRTCECSNKTPRLPLLLRAQTIRDPAVAFRVRTSSLLHLARRVAGGPTPGVDLHYDAAHRLFTVAPRTRILVAQPCLRRPRIVTISPQHQQHQQQEEHEQEQSIPSAQPLTIDVPILDESTENSDGSREKRRNPLTNPFWCREDLVRLTRRT